jgi:hypothetical protein
MDSMNAAASALGFSQRSGSNSWIKSTIAFLMEGTTRRSYAGRGPLAETGHFFGDLALYNYFGLWQGASQIIRGFGNPLEPGRSTWRGADGSAGASPYRSQSHLRSGSGVVVFRRHFGATASFNDCATRPRCEPGTDSLAKPQSSLCLAIPAGRESRPHIGSPFRLKATEVQTTKKLTCARFGRPATILLDALGFPCLPWALESRQRPK